MNVSKKSKRQVIWDWMSNCQTSNKKMEVVYSIVVAWGGGDVAGDDARGFKSVTWQKKLCKSYLKKFGLGQWVYVSMSKRIWQSKHVGCWRLQRFIFSTSRITF
jgi:hypothetical protein